MSLDEVPIEDLRLALVLNGGVSLAVWMGGVAQEINRLSYSSAESGPQGAYGPLLRLTRTRVSVDVISGTSAGGINGAALAMAQVNGAADLRTLRGLWSDQGRMEALLRAPFRGQPTSLLRGDEYFLPELDRAMAGLSEPFARTDRPVDLSITTTLLKGSRRVIPDSLGQPIPQSVHAARFHFHTGSAGDPVDHFAAGTIDDTAAALALAARCSAGFPLAFEPTFVPVRGDRTNALDTARDSEAAAPGADRPDMARFADWRFTDTNPDVPADRSRYAVDGGVLANTPTMAALEAIEKREAEGPLRRVMLLVNPHAPDDEPDPPDSAMAPPTLVGGLGGVLGALLAQGGLSFVEEIERHNRAASTWRGGRADVLRTASIAQLYELVDVAAAQYTNLRRRRAARDLAIRTKPRDQWSFERVRSAALLAQEGFDPLPYVPTTMPPRGGSLDLGDRPGCPLRGWRWGITVAEGIADSASEALRAALSVAKDPEAIRLLGEARMSVSQARLKIVELRRQTDRIWDCDDLLRRLPPTVAYWTARLIAYQRAMTSGNTDDDQVRISAWIEQATLGEPEQALPPDIDARITATVDEIMAWNGQIGDGVAESVWTIAGALWAVRGHIEAIARTPPGALVELGLWSTLINGARLPGPGEPPDPQVRLVMRLLALDVATWLVAEDKALGTSLPINLVQLSLRIRNYFTSQTRSPDDKVAGLSLHRFGGFLKRSWRINDWIWGRLDAATMLARIVLDPQRLSRIVALGGSASASAAADALVTQLETDLFSGLAPPGDPRYRRLRQAAVDELRQTLVAAASTHDLPSYLPSLADLAAYPVQMRIILEELPVLAGAVRADRAEGASPRSRGELLLAEQAELLAEVSALRPGSPRWADLGARALAAFDAAGVGRESPGEELGSDETIRTATTAVAMLATLVDSDRSGVPAIKPVTRVIHGAALLPYWLIFGLTQGRGAARSLALFGFAAGGVLLVLSLFGVLPPPISGLGAAIGIGVLLAAFGYSALRTGSLLHGVALLGPTVPLVVFALTRGGADPTAASAAGTVLVVLAVVAGLVLLASLPWPLRSPLAAVSAYLQRSAVRARGVAVAHTWSGEEWTRQRWLALGRLGLRAVLVGIVIAVAVLVWRSRDSIVGFVTDHVVVLVWVAAGVSIIALIAGCLVAVLRGVGMRTWHPAPGGQFVLRKVAHPSGVAAGWSAVYGAAYLALAWGTGWYLSLRGLLTGDEWILAAVIWFAVLAVALLALAPWLITFLYRLRLRRMLLADPDVNALATPDSAGLDHRLLALLQRRGLTFRYLVDKRTEPPYALGLTLRGQRLADAIRGVRPGLTRRTDL